MSRARASFFEVPQPVREPPPTFDDLIFLCVAITPISHPFLILFKNCEVSELHRLLSQEQQLARTEQAKRLELESVNTRLIETNTDVLNEKDARIQELENKLSKEQNKGFWARIFK